MKKVVIIGLFLAGFQIYGAKISLKNNIGDDIGVGIYFKEGKQAKSLGIKKDGIASFDIKYDACITQIRIGKIGQYKFRAWNGLVCEDHEFELTKDSKGYYHAK